MLIEDWMFPEISPSLKWEKDVKESRLERSLKQAVTLIYTQVIFFKYSTIHTTKYFEVVQIYLCKYIKKILAAGKEFKIGFPSPAHSDFQTLRHPWVVVGKPVRTVDLIQFELILSDLNEIHNQSDSFWSKLIQVYPIWTYFIRFELDDQPDPYWSFLIQFEPIFNQFDLIWTKLFKQMTKWVIKAQEHDK